MGKIKVFQKLLLVVALAGILFGLFHNGFSDIKNKAVRICYECIGIG